MKIAVVMSSELKKGTSISKKKKKKNLFAKK